VAVAADDEGVEVVVEAGLAAAKDILAVARMEATSAVTVTAEVEGTLREPARTLSSVPELEERAQDAVGERAASSNRTRP
jgi:hypothetical protein